MTVPSKKSIWSGVRAQGESLRGRLALTIVVLGLGWLPLPAAQAEQITPEQVFAPDAPVEGRLYNLTSEPFVYRLHRAYGPVWTPKATIAAGGSQSVVAPETGRSNILGVRGDGKGYVIAQYPSYGGQVTVRLPARNPADNKLEPNWFCVTDANGFKRLIQADSEAAARETQTELQAQTPLTAEEVNQLKKSLRANWVLSNEGNPEYTFRR